MQKTIHWMLAGCLLGTIGWGTAQAAPPPVDNTVPPCEDTLNSQKPSCSNDSDSVNVPPKMPHERGVIVPPEVPAEGLPNQDKRRQRTPPGSAPGQPAPVDPSTHKPANELKN